MSLVSTFGRLTRGLRAGEDTLILSRPEFASVPTTIDVTSPAFQDGDPIPLQYTVSGEDISPPVNWSNLPSGTREVVLIIEDYDISLPRPMVHCIVYGLSPDVGGLGEGALPSRNAKAQDPVPRLGRNGMMFQRYDGPAAPPGHGVHHYVFEVFAVSKVLDFKSTPSKDDILAAIEGHVLATGRLTGTFERK
jgi:Raf kinase inhibitor-like YbhB/YbcL family protein